VMSRTTGAFLRRVADGYARILGSVGVATLAIAGSIAVAALIVYPLWWMAVHERTLFNIAFGILAAAAVVAAIIMSLIRRRARVKSSTIIERGRSPLRRIAISLGFLAAAYGTALLWVKASLIIAVAATVILALAAGAAAGAAKVRRPESPASAVDERSSRKQ